MWMIQGLHKNSANVLARYDAVLQSRELFPLSSQRAEQFRHLQAQFDAIAARASMSPIEAYPSVLRKASSLLERLSRDLSSFSLAMDSASSVRLLERNMVTFSREFQSNLWGIAARFVGVTVPNRVALYLEKHPIDDVTGQCYFLHPPVTGKLVSIDGTGVTLTQPLDDATMIGKHRRELMERMVAARHFTFQYDTKGVQQQQCVPAVEGDRHDVRRAASSANSKSVVLRAHWDDFQQRFILVTHRRNAQRCMSELMHRSNKVTVLQLSPEDRILLSTLCHCQVDKVIVKPKCTASWETSGLLRRGCFRDEALFCGYPLREADECEPAVAFSEQGNTRPDFEVDDNTLNKPNSCLV